MRSFAFAMPRVALLAFALSVGLTLFGDGPIAPRQAGGCSGLTSLFRGVGGVSVDTSGVLSNVERRDDGELSRLRAEVMKGVPSDIAQFSPLRKVSLRRLEQAIAEHAKTGHPLPQELQCLAGLQRIQYVFVYPEQNDIVIAGPAEGWKFNERDTLVGVGSGQAVMLLDDLTMMLRHADDATRGNITCSIDPTPEGMEHLRAFVATLRTIGNPSETGHAIEQALGPQKITVTGVPDTSHFAQVLVAADYRMKRIGMALDPSPIQGLPSYLAMASASGRGLSAVAPRWWMVPNYEPMLADEQGLAWELRGASVKTLTEDTYLGAGGATHTGQTSPAAQQWADKMTSKYDELAKRDGIFGELRNVMELAVVAALIRQNDLLSRANLQLGLLADADSLENIELPAPKQTASQASAIKKGSNWVISASGGVQIEAGKVVADVQRSDKLDAPRAAVTFTSDNWWWD